MKSHLFPLSLIQIEWGKRGGCSISSSLTPTFHSKSHSHFLHTYSIFLASTSINTIITPPSFLHLHISHQIFHPHHLLNPYHITHASLSIIIKYQEQEADITTTSTTIYKHYVAVAPSSSSSIRLMHHKPFLFSFTQDFTLICNLIMRLVYVDMRVIILYWNDVMTIFDANFITIFTC